MLDVPIMSAMGRRSLFHGPSGGPVDWARKDEARSWEASSDSGRPVHGCLVHQWSAGMDRRSANARIVNTALPMEGLRNDS